MGDTQDGGTGGGFYRLPDGGIGGPWPEPDDPDERSGDYVLIEGVPASNFAPTAGIEECPSGWQHARDGTCDPQLRADCPTGSEPLPGGICTPTAEAHCPITEYADLGAEAAGARVVHVRAGAQAASADGGVEHPYPTLVAGVSALRGDGWVLVAAGAYREGIAHNRGALHVVGACAARVSLVGDETADGASVEGDGATLDLRGVTLSGFANGLAARRGTLRASAVRVVRTAGPGTTAFGVSAIGAGARVELDGSVVRETRATRAGQVVGGVVGRLGGFVRVTRSVIAENATAELFASGTNTQAEVVDSVVRGGGVASRSVAGLGLEATAGARLRVTSTLVTRNNLIGVHALGVGTSVELSGVVVRETVSLPTEGAIGHGVEAREGAAVRAVGSCLVANVANGLLASGASTRVVLERGVIRDTIPRGGLGGMGILAYEGARVEATGMLLASNHAAGVSLADTGTVGSLTGTVIRDTLRSPADRSAVGAQVAGGASLEASRVVLSGNEGAGLVAANPGTRVSLRESVIRDTSFVHDRGPGRGIDAQDGASVTVEQSRLARNVSDGLALAGEHTRVTLDRSVISDTVPPSPERFCHGINAQSGATLRVTGSLIARTVGVGVRVLSVGTSGVVDRSVVYDTRARTNVTGGHALEVDQGASLEVTNTLVTRATSEGLLALGAGTRGSVSGSAFRDTRPNALRFFGRGLEASAGATLTVRGALFEGQSEVGLGLFGAAPASLSDVLVVGVSPSMRGFGVGLYVISTAVTAERVALVDVAGGGVLTLLNAAVVPRGGEPRVSIADAFVRHVRPGTIRFAETGQTSAPEGREVAYGLHAGAGCVLDATRFTLLDGGHGFYNAGTMTLQRGFIARQRDAAGAFAQGLTPAATRTLEVAAERNGASIVSASDLPSGSALAAAASSCDTGDCN